MNKIKELIREVEKKIKVINLEIKEMDCKYLDDLESLEILERELEDIIRLRDEKNERLKVYEERMK